MTACTHNDAQPFFLYLSLGCPAHTSHNNPPSEEKNEHKAQAQWTSITATPGKAEVKNNTDENVERKPWNSTELVAKKTGEVKTTVRKNRAKTNKIVTS